MTRLRWALLGAVVAASLVAEQFAHHHHDYWFTGIPGFFVGFGFVGCVMLILASKWYGKHLVQRPEAYYEDRADDPHRSRTGVADPGAGDDPEPHHRGEDGAGGRRR